MPSESHHPVLRHHPFPSLGREPAVVPFYHSGMGVIQPRGSTVPRAGHELHVNIGLPMDLSDLTCRCGAPGEDQQQVCWELAPNVALAPSGGCSGTGPCRSDSALHTCSGTCFSIWHCSGFVCHAAKRLAARPLRTACNHPKLIPQIESKLKCTAPGVDGHHSAGAGCAGGPGAGVAAQHSPAAPR